MLHPLTAPQANDAFTEARAEKKDTPSALAAKALRLAETYNTPPIPKTFEVWYAVVSGKPEQLHREVRKLIDKNGAINSYEIDQLHCEFLSLGELQRREQEKTGYELDRGMHRAAGLVQRQIAASDRFAGALKKSANSMMANVSQEKLRDSVDELLVENGKMRAESIKLNHHLGEIRNEVRMLAARLEKARENELRDPLTSIANRRYLDRILKRQVADAIASETALSLVMADIDNFKRINDTYGHTVGDDLLRFFANLLQKNVKGRDTAARYGGEEFALVLPSTDRAEAKLLVQQIMAELGAANLVISKGKQPIGKLTCSFGIAQARSGDNAESLITRADSKLYEAKKAGRNRVVSDG